MKKTIRELYEEKITAEKQGQAEFAFPRTAETTLLEDEIYYFIERLSVDYLPDPDEDYEYTEYIMTENEEGKQIFDAVKQMFNEQGFETIEKHGELYMKNVFDLVPETTINRKEQLEQEIKDTKANMEEQIKSFTNRIKQLEEKLSKC